MIKPGETPIVLELGPIMVAFIITSAVVGSPLRVSEAIALCNEILRSSPKYLDKVIQWKQSRGIYDETGWPLAGLDPFVLPEGTSPSVQIWDLERGTRAATLSTTKEIPSQ